MVPADYEGTVTGVWDVIMQHYFPKSDRYVHRFQDYIAGGFVDRYTYQWVPQPIGPDLQYPFLVTQCKRESRNDAQAFTEGEDQLNRYMPALQAHAWGNPIYGIVAVGKRARFYILRGGKAEFLFGKVKYEIDTDGHIIHWHLVYT